MKHVQNNLDNNEKLVLKIDMQHVAWLPLCMASFSHVAWQLMNVEFLPCMYASTCNSISEPLCSCSGYWT